jgi:GT2 family glycosyltransferase
VSTASPTDVLEAPAAEPVPMDSPIDPPVDVSVVVVSWNTRELLRECLEAVLASTGVAIEVLVVDNASSDGSSDMVRQTFPGARLLVNSENLGFAVANNQALRLARGRYALLLNSDAIVPPDGIAKLTAFMEDHPAAGLAGPMYVFPDGSFQASYADFPTLGEEMMAELGLMRWRRGSRYPSHDLSQSREARAVDWIGGTCLLARLAAVAQVGLLDEGFFFYTEEVDWCRRMALDGWQVWYDPGVVVVHHLGQSAQGSGAQRLGHLYRGRLRYFAKHAGRPSAACLKAWFVLGLGTRALISRLPGRRHQAADARALEKVARELWSEPIG